MYSYLTEETLNIKQENKPMSLTNVALPCICKMKCWTKTFNWHLNFSRRGGTIIIAFFRNVRPGTKLHGFLSHKNMIRTSEIKFCTDLEYCANLGRFRLRDLRLPLGCKLDLCSSLMLGSVDLYLVTTVSTWFESLTVKPVATRCTEYTCIL